MTALMNYDTLVMASKLAALGIFLPLYVGFLVYAYWGPNREKLQAYATIPFEDGDPR